MDEWRGRTVAFSKTTVAITKLSLIVERMIIDNGSCYNPHAFGRPQKLSLKCARTKRSVPKRRKAKIHPNEAAQMDLCHCRVPLFR